MKKLIAVMLCALLALIPALAEGLDYAEPEVDELPELQEIFDYLEPEIEVMPELQEMFNQPESEVDEAPEQPQKSANPEHDLSTGDTFVLNYRGRAVSLDFDASTQYSNIDDGLVQASFYKYEGNSLYELFVIFSSTAAPGTEITPDYAALDRPETSIVLRVSDTKTYQEQYYMTSLMGGALYPAGSDFTICVDEIHDLDGKVSYVGRLSATLVALDMATGEVTDTLTIPETPFAFTIGGSSGSTPAPIPTKAPDDRRKV